MAAIPTNEFNTLSKTVLSLELKIACRSNPTVFNILALFSIDTWNGGNSNNSRPIPVH